MIRNHVVVWGALLSWIPACYDLPDVEPGVCGNLAVEAEEDCDGFAALGEGTACGVPESDNACSLICDPAAEGGAVCPEGWGCGQDGRCRRASGLFAPAPDSPWRMPVESFAIGDVDGDRNADLIGNNQQSLTVRFGSPTGEFPDELEFNIRRPTGPVTYDFFDQDHRIDAIIPIEEGISVMLGSEERTLEPVAYAPFGLPPGFDLEFQVVDILATPFHEVMYYNPAENTLAFLGSAEQYDLSLPAASTGSVPARPIPVADIDGDGRQEVVLAYPDDDVVRVYTTAGDNQGGNDNLRAVEMQVLDLPGPLRVNEGALFADVDGNGQLDLLISVRDDAGNHPVAVAYAIGGALQPPRVELVFSRPLSSRALPLAAADLNGDNLADYVYPEGIAVALATSDIEGTPPDAIQIVAVPVGARFSDAAIGDFNADGLRDVAAALVDLTGANPLEGVDVYVGAGASLFNKFHVDTDRPPRGDLRSFAVGDFDGDRVTDLAFAEDGRGVEEDELTVLFGARDGGFAKPVSMGKLDRIEQVLAALTVTGLDTIDAISDLFLVSAREGSRGVSIMVGDSSRRMISPFVLDPSVVEGEGPPENAHVPARVVVGEFNGDEFPDLLSVAVSPAVDGRLLRTFVWFLPGQDAEGGLTPAGASFADLDAYDEFEIGCSTWTAVDLDAVVGQPGTGADELLGLDGSARCFDVGDEPPELLVVKVDPEASQPFTVEHQMMAGGVSQPDDLAAADLDGDGDLDPIVLFRGEWRATPSDQAPSGAGVAILWNQDGQPASSAYGRIEVAGATRLVGIAPLQLDDDGFRDLVILTDTGLFQALYDPAAQSFGEPTLLVEQLDGRLIAAGDVNGDGLDDLAIVSGENVDVRLAVPRPPLGSDATAAGRP